MSGKYSRRSWTWSLVAVRCKILEAYPSKGPFAETNEFCKQNGIQHPRPKRLVTEEILHGAFVEDYHRSYIGRKFTRCRDQPEELRDSIAHPFLSQKTWLDLDNPQNQAHLSAMANLLERIAIVIIQDEFDIWARLIGSDEYAELAKSYTG